MLPSYGYLSTTLGLPAAVSFEPFAMELDATELPPRCRRCKAYLQSPAVVGASGFTCLFCGRLNPPSGQFEPAPNPADCAAQGPRYAPASADAAAGRGEFLPPAEVSHVASEVLAEAQVRRAALSAIL